MAKKKIQVRAIEMTCPAQVIFIDAATVIKVMRAYMTLKPLIDSAEHAKQVRVENEDGEKIWQDVLDEQGNTVKEYYNIDGNAVADVVLPVLKEMVDAFEEEHETLVP